MSASFSNRYRFHCSALNLTGTGKIYLHMSPIIGILGYFYPAVMGYDDPFADGQTYADPFSFSCIKWLKNTVLQSGWDPWAVIPEADYNARVCPLG